MQKGIMFFWTAMLVCVFIFATALTQTPETTAQTESSPTKTLSVNKIACGTGVVDRELQGQDTVFSESSEKIYCWVNILGGSEGVTVNFIWYHGGKEVAKIPIAANYPRTRTWSYKSMYIGAKGEWKVEVTDSNNQVLGSTSFKIQ
jgi:hypothetical protein